MTSRLDLVETTYEGLCGAADRIARTRAQGHLHTTPPGCIITERGRHGIVVEATDEGRVLAFFDDQPIEARARPLAILLHGPESVPDDTESLAPASAAVETMAERMRLGKGHFHILNPVCRVNPHPGRWTILFEDAEQGVLTSVSDERPLADIRLVERLIYASRREE